MGEMKQARSPKLGVIFQLTEIEATEPGGRAWEIHDVERNRGFSLALGPTALAGFAEAVRTKTLDAAVLEAAILVALERSLQSPPEKLDRGMYTLELTTADFQPVSAQ